MTEVLCSVNVYIESAYNTTVNCRLQVVGTLRQSLNVETFAPRVADPISPVIVPSLYTPTCVQKHTVTAQKNQHLCTADNILGRVYPIKPVSNVRPPTKSFFDFNEKWPVGRGR